MILKKISRQRKSMNNFPGGKELREHEGQIFLLVDLREFFSDLGSGDEKK